MRTRSIVVLAASALFIMPAIALADCHDTAGKTAGTISKDGTTAPMEAPDQMAERQPDGGTTTNMESGSMAAGASGNGQGSGIVQDGTTMPMASEPGEADTNVATSPADVAAQQEGGETAAAQARDGCTN